MNTSRLNYGFIVCTLKTKSKSDQPLKPDPSEPVCHAHIYEAHTGLVFVLDLHAVRDFLDY